MRNGITAHRASENQKNRRKDCGLDHRQRNAEHYLDFRRIEDSCRFFKVCVHITENTADEDIGKCGIMKSEHYNARENTLTPPKRHTDSEKRREQTVARVRYKVAVEKVSPYHRQRPLRHNVWENEYCAQIFFEFEICSCHEEGKKPAEDYRRNAGEKCNYDGIQKRRPKVRL